MSIIYKVYNYQNIIKQLVCKNFFNNFKRNICITSILQLKQIHIKPEKDSIIIEGTYIASPRENFILPQIKDSCSNKCPECHLGLNLKHTDVLILSQYVRTDGCMLPRRITGLCRRQQKKIGTLVTMAQKAGLMANLTPLNSLKDPQKRHGWKKFNKYYDENTIKC